MPQTQFDRDSMARWYAQRHLQTDPGVHTVYYLPGNAPENEIRLLEVNTLMAERNYDTLEPFDFGVDVGSEAEHKLWVLDVTPSQLERIRHEPQLLPPGWSLEHATVLGSKGNE
jgi:hypothetical protein